MTDERIRVIGQIMLVQQVDGIWKSHIQGQGAVVGCASGAKDGLIPRCDNNARRC